jgi:hypothetical protein
LERLEEGGEAVGVAETAGALDVGVEDQHGEMESVLETGGFGAPEIATHVNPEHETADLAFVQARAQPVVQSRVGPMKGIDGVIEIVIRESLEWRLPRGRNGTGRRQTTFARFGGVEDHAAAGGFDVVEQGPLRGEQRAADQREGNALTFQSGVCRNR